MKKLLFVFNPFAGKEKIKPHISDIVDVFVKGGYEVAVHPTQAKGDAHKTVKTLGCDFDAVVCSGGDGTLNETISALMQIDEKIPLGYIPSGTFNDFAANLKIPKNMVEAARRIAKGDTYEIDVGAFNNKFFTYFAGFGMFTNVSYETPQHRKNVLGSAAYMLEAIKQLGAVKNYKVTVTYDNSKIEDEFVFGMVSNSHTVGGISGLSGKDVLLDDGEFECLLIKNSSLLSETHAVADAVLHRELNPEHLYFFKASKIDFRCGDELPWTLDGEFGGSKRNVTIENKHRAITLFA